MNSIWFWQQTITPHLAHLADALAQEHVNVFYVANISISTKRSRMGWTYPSLSKVKIKFIPDHKSVRQLLEDVPCDSIHICEGLRGNGLVSYAQQQIIAKGLKPWIIMETVDDSGIIKGFIKRQVYRQVIRLRQSSISGILSIGHRTSQWLIDQGANPKKVFPFTYFLPDSQSFKVSDVCKTRPFRILFVGQLIKRKRVDLLLKSLACQVEDMELVIIGDGPMRVTLERMAESLLPERVCWLGSLPMAEIPQMMADADCLVLPSRHDGWGVVVSEALMAGTPVICSDACGSAGVVQASGVGGVFSSVDRRGLSDCLAHVLNVGPLGLCERQRITKWAHSLGCKEGVVYLRSILNSPDIASNNLVPPWIVR